MLSQIGRGAVLLTSMALVACYIDVYATGRFPWQHAAAESPATVPPPEFVNDPAVQPAQFVAEPTSPASPLYLSGTKSFTGQTTVLPGSLDSIPQTPTEPPSSTKLDVTRYTTPLFLSASKSLSAGPAIGAHPIVIFAPPPPSPTATAEALNKPATVSPFNAPRVGDANAPGTKLATDQSAPTLPQHAPPGISTASYPQSPGSGSSANRPNAPPQQAVPPVYTPPIIPARTPPPTSQFMGGSKTIMLPTRLPEIATPSSTPPAAPAVSPEKMQFMSGFKSPGPAVMPGSSIPAPTPRVQLPTQAPATGKPSANMPQQQAVPPNSANQPPLFMSGAKSPLRHSDLPNAGALPPQQQQAIPPKIAPPNAPQSPAGSY